MSTPRGEKNPFILTAISLTTAWDELYLNIVKKAASIGTAAGKNDGGITMDTKTLFNLTYGLFVFTSRFDGKDSGCIINTAGQVTDTPNRISVTVNKANFTHDLAMKSGIFNVSILSEAASFDTFRHFGFQSGRDVDKFAGYDSCQRSGNGLYYITAGTNGVLSAKVEQAVDLGTHTLFIATLDDMKVLSDVPSATYAYYHANIKPKPQAPKAKGKTVWRCVICGYIYEGKELPADFICPLCKHPASDFEKVVVE